MLDVPIYAVAGFLGAIAGAGGSYAVTKKQSTDNRDEIKAVKEELKAHTAADGVAFNEILRSLGRIEGTLQEMNRSK